MTPPLLEHEHDFVCKCGAFVWKGIIQPPPEREYEACACGHLNKWTHTPTMCTEIKPPSTAGMYCGKGACFCGGDDQAGHIPTVGHSEHKPTPAPSAVEALVQQIKLDIYAQVQTDATCNMEHLAKQLSVLVALVRQEGK